MHKTNEQWREMENCPYLISNTGRVKSLDRMVKTNIKNVSERLHKGKELKCSIDSTGYKVVTLRNGKNAIRDRVHRLVAKLFIPNPLNKKEVNHKDGNKLNNCVENLEWVTPKENNIHARSLGLIVNSRGEGCSKAKLTDAQVSKIRRWYHIDKISSIEIARRLKMSPSHIWRVACGKNWKHIEKIASLRRLVNKNYY